MKKTRVQYYALGGLFIVFALGSISFARPTYDFRCIAIGPASTAGTGNSAQSAGVDHSGARWNPFSHGNTGHRASSITDAGFSSGLQKTLTLQPALLEGYSSGNVEFSKRNGPWNLPAGSNAKPGFFTRNRPGTNPDSPRHPARFRSQAYAKTRRSLAESETYHNVPGESETGELQIAPLAEGESKSYISDPPAVPVPGSILLAGVGIAMVRLIRSHKSSRALLR